MWVKHDDMNLETPMTHSTISDAALEQIILASRQKGSETLALDLLEDPRIVRDFARQHVSLGQIVLPEQDPAVEGLCLRMMRLLADDETAAKGIAELALAQMAPEILKAMHDELFAASRGDGEVQLPETFRDRLEATTRSLLARSSYEVLALGLAGNGEGTGPRYWPLLGREIWLKNDAEVLEIVRTFLTIEPSPGMTIEMQDLLPAEAGVERHCTTVLGLDSGSIAFPEGKGDERARARPAVMHYTFEHRSDRLLVADTFRMAGVGVYKELLAPRRGPSINGGMGQNICMSENLARTGGLYVVDGSDGFQTLGREGRIVAAQFFKGPPLRAAVVQAARERGVAGEDIRIWEHGQEGYEDGDISDARSRAAVAAVEAAFPDLLPQRNTTSTLWAVQAIAPELLLEMAEAGIRHVIDNPGLKNGRADTDISFILQDIKAFGCDPEVIAQAQMDRMMDQGFVDVHMLAAGDYHIYKPNFEHRSHARFSDLIMKSLPELAGSQEIKLVISREPLDLPAASVWEVELDRQRLPAEAQPGACPEP